MKENRQQINTDLLKTIKKYSIGILTTNNTQFLHFSEKKDDFPDTFIGAMVSAQIPLYKIRNTEF